MGHITKSMSYTQLSSQDELALHDEDSVLEHPAYRLAGGARAPPDLVSSALRLHETGVAVDEQTTQQDYLAQVSAQCTLFCEVCGAGEDEDLTTELRSQLVNTQTDIQSRCAVEQNEEALMALLAANDEIDAALKTQKRESHLPEPEPPRHEPLPGPADSVGVSVEVAEQAPPSSMDAELEEILGTAAPHPVAYPVLQPVPQQTLPTQLVKTKSAEDFDAFFASSGTDAIFSEGPAGTA